MAYSETHDIEACQMKDLAQIRRQYIEAALLHKKASSEGDYRTANTQARTLKKIYQKIEVGDIASAILSELLSHESISVRGWAAAHLLGLKQETEKAERVLSDIAAMSGKDIEENLDIFSAQIILRIWKEQGYLKF